MYYFVDGTGYFEMWRWRWMEVINWADRVRNEEVSHRVEEERNHRVTGRIALVASHVETAF